MKKKNTRTAFACSGLILLSSFFSLYSFAQEKIVEIGKIEKSYKAKVYCLNDIKVKGILYKVADSTVILIDRVEKRKYIEQVFDTVTFNKINKIRLTRQGSGGIGFTIGALISIATGFLIAKGVAPDDDNPQAIPIAGGIILAPVAGTLGALIGGSSGKYLKVNYDYNQFRSVKSKLTERAYLK